MANTSIFGIVVSKLRYEKKPYPIILRDVDKSSELNFYCTIWPLSLAVYLWVKSYGESLLDAKEIV